MRTVGCSIISCNLLEAERGFNNFVCERESALNVPGCPEAVSTLRQLVKLMCFFCDLITTIWIKWLLHMITSTPSFFRPLSCLSLESAWIYIWDLRSGLDTTFECDRVRVLLLWRRLELRCFECSSQSSFSLDLIWPPSNYAGFYVLKGWHTIMTYRGYT